MTLQNLKENNATIVSIDGKIDTLNAPEFENYLNQFTENSPFHLIIDCTKLEYISSAGLRVLLINAKKAKAQASQFDLKNINNSVKQVLDLTGFTALFNIL